MEHDAERLRSGLLDLLDRWSATRGKADDEGVLLERHAVERLHAAWQDLDLAVTASMTATGSSPLMWMSWCPDCAIAHIIKADVSYRGSFSLLARSTAEYLSTLGIREYNIQEDMGIEGLRTSKLRWRPVRMERLYRVRARTT